MRLSAVFIVDEIAETNIKRMKEINRMNYLLGIGEDESFEEHILMMEDFTETQDTLYDEIKKRLCYPSALCEQSMYRMYCEEEGSLHLLPFDKLLSAVRNLDQAVSVKERQKMKHGLYEMLDIEDWIVRFMELIKFAIKHHCSMIFVFKRQDTNHFT